MANDLLYFNGVNGATGDYGLPPMTGERLVQFIRGEAPPENLNELRFRHEQKDQEYFGIKEGVDPKNLAEAGWGVIFAHDADPAIKEALSSLLELRQGQAGGYYHLYEKGDGYRVGADNKAKFLARHGAGPGPADPEKVPYYLLIVGSPEVIDYRFQSQLDVQYAVGRIDFGDNLDAYDNYARSVVEAESKRVKLSREISLFGVANDDDRATQLSAENLISPLAEHLKGNQDWTTKAFLKDAAKKSQLSQLLGGEQTPALLFTASHGMEFPLGDPRQIPHQGALLCQDWPGPEAWRGRGAIPQDLYFAGDDLPSNANLLGLLGFFFACYGGGTPRLDEFTKQAFKNQRAEIAPYSFLASLPTRMLSNPGGGALALVGHVERAWGYSFVWQGAGPQTVVFESTLDRLLDGHPVGSAVEYLNERYAELSTVLNDELEQIEYGKQGDPYDLAGMWTANNDARGYTIIGDPAVRLPVAEADEEAQARPVIALKPIKALSPEDQLSDLSETNQTSSTPPTTDDPASKDQPDKESDMDPNEGFAPPPVLPEGYREKYPELYQAWVAHIKAGYDNNEVIFKRILDAFMQSHQATLIMNWIIFGVGILFFVAAVILALVQGEVVGGIAFGGLSVISFLAYFISRPTQAVAENLQFITWLGIIYNSYWTQLAWSFDEKTAQATLDKATKDAVAQLNALIDKHAQVSRRRPNLGKLPGQD